MTGTEFRYVTYIAASPEQVWDALTRPELTREFWQHENVSDWKLGSVWEHREPGGGAAKMTGLVIQHDPPRHLLLTWADAKDAANLGAHSRVTIDLEPVDQMTKLTLLHDQLVPSSAMYRDIMDGWPRVLASLKSFLETGHALPVFRSPEARRADGVDDRMRADRTGDDRIREEERLREEDRIREARLAEAQREMARRETPPRRGNAHDQRAYPR